MKIKKLEILRQKIGRHVRRKLMPLRWEVVRLILLALKSSSESLFSLQNSDGYLLSWYAAYLVLYLVVSYRLECKLAKKIKRTARRGKKKKRKKNPALTLAQKTVDPYDLLAMKFVAQLPYVFIAVAGCFIQWPDFEGFAREELFGGIIMGTFVPTVTELYYRLVLHQVSTKEGLLNKAKAMIAPNLIDGSYLKKICLGAMALFLLVRLLACNCVLLSSPFGWLLWMLDVFELLKLLTSERKGKA